MLPKCYPRKRPAEVFAEMQAEVLAEMLPAIFVEKEASVDV